MTVLACASARERIEYREIPCEREIASDAVVRCIEFPPTGLRERFPEIKDVELIDHCQLTLTQPQWTRFYYSPRITAPHTAATRELECDAYPSHMECEFRSREVHFDVDPAKYFEVAEPMPLQEALDAVRAYRSGRLIGSNEDLSHLENLEVWSVKRKNGEIILEIGVCGCGGFVAVKWEEAPSGRSLRILRAPEILCI